MKTEITPFKRRLSPSAINCFAKCPRGYFYQYIERRKSKPSIHLVKGIIVHEVLEYFYKAYNPNPKEHLFNLLKAKIKKFEKSIKMLEMEDDQIAHHIKDCEIILETYWMNIEQKMKGLIHNGKAENMNHAWYLIKPKLKEKYVKSKKLNCVGYIDRVHKDYDGVTTLGDYKTSNKFGIGLPMDYKRQLAIYALLYKEQELIMPDFVSVIFLRFGEEFLLEVTPSLLKFARDTILETHSKTFSDDIKDYPLKEGPLCGWCDFNTLCSGEEGFVKKIRQTKLIHTIKKEILCEFCGSKDYEENESSSLPIIKHKKTCEYIKTKESDGK